MGKPKAHGGIEPDIDKRARDALVALAQSHPRMMNLKPPFMMSAIERRGESEP